MPPPIASPTERPPRSVERTRKSDMGPSCRATRKPRPNPIQRACIHPRYRPHFTPRKARLDTTATTVALDPIDSEILRLLREDGRLSWRDLGAAVGLSANAAADRVRRLRQAGVITGFVALIDPAAGGRHLEALVGVTLRRGTDSDAFAIAVSRLEPVIEGLHLSGAPDYQLRVACRDTAELDALLRTLRNRAGAADTETTIVLRSGPPR